MTQNSLIPALFLLFITIIFILLLVLNKIKPPASKPITAVNQKLANNQLKQVVYLNTNIE